ncbi:MAG: MBL fold metallo-hydrolase [Chloroflexi bacterium]|nr:MAG: MBL fold metallo-hydrolase [Chloroflexota bacterium]MBL1195953.1 MBL fold metallo-hydrolase [Chloroflexota bacterium]NOH13247.1 MBL fold metallo-hydrolase [Chloroflexota bacterium]
MSDKDFESVHFQLKQLADGVYAAIATEDGLAYSNAAIINMGDQTIVMDSFNSIEAGRDLREAAEVLFDRAVSKLIISHPHDDHWNGNAAFDESTTILSTPAVLTAMQETAKEWQEDKENPDEYQKWIQGMKDRLSTEEDPRWQVGLERSIKLYEHVLATLPDFELRLPDETFQGNQTFVGTKRKVELISVGPVHSTDDCYLVLPDDGIVFLADIGFFRMQPFMGFCDINAWRKQIDHQLAGEYEVFVPGHGDVGGKAELAELRKYMDAMEKLVSETLSEVDEEAARQVEPPAPFDAWLMGGMGRLEANINYLIKHLQGQEDTTKPN